MDKFYSSDEEDDFNEKITKMLKDQKSYLSKDDLFEKITEKFKITEKDIIEIIKDNNKPIEKCKETCSYETKYNSIHGKKYLECNNCHYKNFCKECYVMLTWAINNSSKCKRRHEILSTEECYDCNEKIEVLCCIECKRYDCYCGCPCGCCC